MRVNYSIISAALACVLALPASLAAQSDDIPQVTKDGLVLVPDSNLALVYAEPGASLAGYKRVQLLDAYVAFKKNWERDQRSRSADPLSLTSRDVERIRNDLAGLFRTVFTEVLTEGGYAVVDESGDDVLLVRPAIINLDINAPDTRRASRSQVYAASAGEMTLYVELYDSVTSDLLAQAVDRRVDRENDNFYTWTNSVTNRVAAERILKGWAGILLKALDEARQLESVESGNDSAGSEQ